MFAMKSRLWLTILLCLAAWQLCAIAMIFFYGRFLNRPLSAAYAACFGNVQTNYGAFERTMTYFGNFVVTAPATWAVIVLFDRLKKRRLTAKTRAIGFLGWQWFVWSALIGAYKYGISYKINQLDWAVFGPPADLYSFRNFILHRIVTWFLCTIPTGMIALWVYTRMTMARPAGFPVVPSTAD